jgi:predicted RNA binding protein YcfA (HicA-like mRNA interferase family)
MKQELPALKSVEVIKALEKAGFRIKRKTGSHFIMFKTELKRPLTVPMHSKDLPTGTLRAIIRQANLTIEEFLHLL